MLFIFTSHTVVARIKCDIGVLKAAPYYTIERLYLVRPASLCARVDINYYNCPLNREFCVTVIYLR